MKAVFVATTAISALNGALAAYHFRRIGIVAVVILVCGGASDSVGTSQPARQINISTAL